MNKAHNRKTSRILGALIITALVLVMIFSAFPAISFARADDVDLTFTQTDVSPDNANFASSSGASPASPNSWTGSGLGGLGSGNTVAGVMNLTTYLANKDSYKLDKYFEGSSSPNSPFGLEQGNYEGNRNVLLINVLSDSTAYGFTSATVTFTANRFYLVEAWVSTGNFSSESGAAIRVNGLDEDIVFNKINTSGTTANYGWEKFSFYIASSSLEDKSATVSLQVGDKYDEYFYPALGYAMFDNVSILEIAPSTFYEAKETAHTKVFDLSSKTTEQFEYLENLDFTSAVPNQTNWTNTSAGEDWTGVTVSTYNASNTFYEDNRFNLTSDPYSANGKYENGDSDILVISSYNGSLFRSVAVGVASPEINIERYHYYRISVWAKSQEVTEGSGATFALSAIRDESENVGRYEGKNLFATITSCTGDTSNKARGGFSQYSFYVKGSALRDYGVSIQCWLGTPDNKSRGIALFDNVTVEEITPDDYTTYSANGTIVDMDTYAGIDGSAFITYPSTGITNGNFYEIDTYEEFGYPLAPLGWTKCTTSEASANGYSAIEVSTDKAISGIIPTDNETFDKYSDDFGSIAFNPDNNGANVLMLYSSERTAYAYRSSEFTVTASTPGKLTVTLLTSGMDSSDYGASLVLKNGSSIISTIEKVKTNNVFKTYTFYIEPASVDITTLSVEVWLGNIDRDKNTTKLSKGLIYVKEAAYEDIADEYASDGTTVTKAAAQIFSEYKADCDSDKNHNREIITRAAYSFNGIDPAAYDYYDSSFVKYPYNWQMSATGTFSNTVHYGIFNPASQNRDTALVPESFNMDELSSDNVLMLYNAGPASSTLTYNGSLDVAADTYYRIDIAVKVDIPENQERANATGVKITLNGETSIAFENIKDTSTVSDSIVNKESFKTYSFYIYPGESDNAVSLSISLGGSAYSEQCSGRVYIGSIAMTDINADLYNTAVAETTKRDDGEEYNAAYERVLIADYSPYAVTDDETTDDEITDDTETADSGEGESLAWWLIPSILFAVAILIAIVGFIIRKALEKRAAKKTTTEKTVSYDRNATLNVEHNKTADEKDKVESVSVDSDANYEAFDDDAVVTEKAAPAPEPVSESAPEESATAEETTTESVAAPVEEKPVEEKPAEEKPEPKADAFIDRFDD